MRHIFLRASAALFGTALLLAMPIAALAVNNLQFTTSQQIDTVTTDTHKATLVTVSAGSLVTGITVHSGGMDVTVDSGSSATFTAAAGEYLKVLKVSGSQAFSATPMCPTTTVVLSGSGATAVLRLQVFSQNQVSGCTGSTTAGGNGIASVPSPSSVSDAEAPARLALLQVLGLAAHDLIKLPSDNNPRTQADSAVYYVGADGRRHAFPNAAVYGSWYCDFSKVRVVTASQLSQIPLGKNVTFKSGLRLVKFPTSNPVYLVQPGNVLRVIGDEATAVLLFGADWNKKVSDISEAFFADYVFGDSLSVQGGVNLAALNVSPKYPSGNMGITGYVDAPVANVAMSCGASVPVSTSPAPLPTVWPFKELPISFTFTTDLGVESAASVSIRFLQDLLTYLGPAIYPEARITGNFGPATEAAVVRFQAQNGITDSGFVGPETRAKLNALLAQYRASVAAH